MNDLEEPPSRYGHWFAAAIALTLAAGWYFLYRNPAPSDGPPPAEAAQPAVTTSTATLKEAQDYFEKWGGYLIWENGTAEFALWTPADRDYTRYFEVREINGMFAFRQIAKLTRPLIDHGDRARSRMAFTETTAMRADFYRRNPNFKPVRLAWSDAAEVPELPPKPPRRLAPAAPPAGLPSPGAPSSTTGERMDPNVAAGLARGAPLIVEFSYALSRSGRGTFVNTADLLALFRLHPVSPIPDAPTPAELATGIEQRKAANESIATMATALMSPQALEIFRATLNREIAALEARRR